MSDQGQVAIVERVRALEVRVEHANGKLDHMAEKVDELHALLLQAKGARWAILGLGALGGVVGAKATTFWNLLR